MDNTEQIWRLIDAKKPDFEALADRIWHMPELAYTETRSCAEHTAMLQQQGFRVTEQVAGIPTAVMGEAGEGGPVIAILGEYDALPGLSQEAGVAEPRPLPGPGFGHGCGHNLLGSASLLAATAVKDYLAAHKLPGRVRYYGCPAEEGGAAKGFMVRDGAFSDVDIAISWHPAAFAAVQEAISLANTRIDFSFTGRASHAAAAPHLGRSALDAVELMNVGVNYMREHMPSDARVHYAYLDAGGVAPNVVQPTAKVRYLIRARDLVELKRLIERVRKIADGAALMTETKVEAKIVSGVSNLMGNLPLERAMQANFDRLGPPPFDDADRAKAAEFQATLTEEDVTASWRRIGLPVRKGVTLCDVVVPLEVRGAPMMGSTDVGDVSWVVPTVQARGAVYAIGTPGHSWQLTGQGMLPAAHKGMVHVAKVMAGTAVDAILNPAIIETAKADLAERTAGNPYTPVLSPDVQPPFDMSKGAA
ncbi:M20 family metallopeptidase [Paeniroseomonas aquatica]|uniref:M20 family metallopeptidase n=1 Tax=Paeniroseomonas aquatica TaxID=373043 RepID=A0ABT8ACW1_9PROT|nr:M20 family metallopeptidase [Paeniroseomonas aquatica]MDN3567358.1 M20 family metallopeptidase [Paeniroseomonas aquatica]